MIGMEEMIRDVEEKRKPNEVILFAIGAGRIAPVFGKKKQMEKTLMYIKGLDGFVGVNPMDLWHTLLLFDTLNNAKLARNKLEAKGVPVGQVAPVLVDKAYLGGDV